MPKKTLSTFEREMQDPAFKKQFDREYKEFLLSEIIRELMESSHKSVRKLASESGISSTAIQNIRSGIQQDMKLTNFLDVSHACGYRIVLVSGNKRIML